MVEGTNIEVMLDTMVLEIEGKIIHAINTEKGYLTIEAEAIVLAMGCRERTRGAISIPEIDHQEYSLQGLLKDLSIWKATW